MRNKKFHIYLSDFEYHHIINSLIELKNSLIAQRFKAESLRTRNGKPIQ